MAIDLERTMDRVLQMAEASQKAKGIDNFGSQGYRNALERDKAAVQRNLRDQQLLDEEKLKATERMTTRSQDVESAKAEATLANANAVAQAKNQNALQVAAIRANGGLGRKDPSVMTAHEETQAAIEWAKANPGLPGKPGMSIEEARAAIRPKATPVKNADGTIAAAETPETPEQRTLRQALVPGHKNDPLGRAVDPSTVGVNTPKGEAPTALSANQWQQYADSKSPGMKYEGNQLGMVGDQIARFKRPDGSTFFANTGAAKMQLGDALTPAAAPPPLANTPGSVPRATMPDASNRSAMNTVKAPAPAPAPAPEKYMTNELGEIVPANPGHTKSFSQYYDEYRRSNAEAAKGDPNAFNTLGMESSPSISKPVTTREGTEPSSKKMQGFLNWYEQTASRNMPAYLQSRAAMQPVDAGQKMSELFKWWKDKSGRNMPKYAYPGSNM